MLDSSDITLTDMFCGAGGSSTGAALVDGVRVVHAANHWKLAVETHAHNHPDTNHDLCDLTEVHPCQFPKTTLLWASPECRSHTVAKGRKRKAINQMDLWGDNRIDPSEERNRATMREVVEFAEYHQYEAVIVENVTEIRLWQYYETWLKAMIDLGYDYKEVFFNSMFAHPTPQSRDRIYVVFWKRGNPAPDLDIHPLAWCESCGQHVDSVFSPKHNRLPARVLYGKSYVYRCPNCAEEVEPYYYAAFNAIDWSLPIERIGERAKPLASRTRQRIQRGLDKYRGQYMVVDLSRPGTPGKIYSITMPHPAVTTTNNYALAMPLILSYYTRKTATRGVDDAMPVIPAQNRHALIMPQAFISTFRRGDAGRGLDNPMSTVTAQANHHALIQPMPFSAPYYGNSSPSGYDDALPTQPTKMRHNLIAPDDDWDIENCGFRMLQPHEIQRAMGFPDDYVVLGNKAEKVKQCGNAVTPPVAQLLVERIVASLD